MKEVVYRIIVNKLNYTKRVMFDQENWLLDGISGYFAATKTETVPTYIDAFTNGTATFRWHGYGSMEQYGATHTFFEYLEKKYSSEVIDKTLYYLGTGMISNHRCDTMENCAILQSVYNVSNLDFDNKKYTIDVDTLFEEWVDYVAEHYNVTVQIADR